MVNRSAPPCEVVPVVAYGDVDAAVRWLQAAFCMRIRLHIASHRVQMWFGTSCLVVGETGVYAPETLAYGERQATLIDYAGHRWTLTRTIQNVEPSAWGGEAVEL